MCILLGASKLCRISDTLLFDVVTVLHPLTQSSMHLEANSLAVPKNMRVFVSLKMLRHLGLG